MSSCYFRLFLVLSLFVIITQCGPKKSNNPAVNENDDLSPDCRRLVGRKRIRKEVNRLTSQEKSVLKNAMKQAMKPHPDNGFTFGDIANYHGAPYEICFWPGNPKEGKPCCMHSSNGFLPWHRFYLVQLDEILEPYLKDTDLGLPYWDWTKNSSIPDLWEDVFSPIKDYNNPHYDAYKRRNDFSICQNKSQDQPPESYSQRIKPEFNRLSKQRSHLKNAIDSILEEDDFRRFSSLLEGQHGIVHISLACTMQFIITAAYDPIFWLHHGFIDKIWAERQNNPDLPQMTNTELKNTILEPFGDSTHNPFELSKKSQEKALDYENNLCYCYDCDLKELKVDKSSRTESKDPFVESKKRSLSNGRSVSQKYRFYKVKSYIGLIVPKDLGEKTVAYKLCYEKDNCTSGETSFFGTNNHPKITKIPIDKEKMVIHKCLIERNNRNIYDAVQWTNIHLTGDHVVPKETPPFMIVKVTNGIDHNEFVQLPYGVSKKAYGNLLDDYSVSKFCGTVTWDKAEGQTWKIGNPKICEWKEEDFNSYLPKEIIK